MSGPELPDRGREGAAGLRGPARPVGRSLGDGQGDTQGDVRGALHYPAFRRLAIALGLASFGDWLGLLALTALAKNLAGDDYVAGNLAISAVFILRLLPAIIFGPFAGVVADRLDRRTTMALANLARAAVLASILVLDEYWWLFIATFLLEVASLFFIPAKEATVPNLVPRERLEEAEQVNLLTTYGPAPLAAGVFASLALVIGVIDEVAPFEVQPVQAALALNALTFLVSGVMIARNRRIPHGGAVGGDEQGMWRTIVDGWSFIARTRLVRGLVVGMLGAFAAGGAVVGLARTYVEDLGAGEPGYGLLFGVVFLGLASGMGLGPRLFRGFSRRRLFGLSLTLAGASLALLALIPNLVIAVLLTFAVGTWAGISWITGYTLLGLEVADEMRGRTFAFVQTTARITLVLVLAVAPLLAAALGQHTVQLRDITVDYNGAALTFLIGAVLAMLVGVAAYRQMDDRRGVPLWTDLVAALRHTPVTPPGGHTTGLLVALEGGEGAGKSTQAKLLADRLHALGHEVVVTREPGATPVGARLRELLLDPATRELAPRAEALLYAADRADHVHRLVRPALERGAVVITDRYIDSSLAYQGAGRVLPPDDVLRISRWATQGLVPDLTVVLDVPPHVGLSRFGGRPDRLEAEPVDFHQRVRGEFLRLAGREPERYLVADATLSPEQVLGLIWARLEKLLPVAAGEQAQRDEHAERVDARAEQRRQAEQPRAAAQASGVAPAARPEAMDSDSRARGAHAAYATRRAGSADATAPQRGLADELLAWGDEASPARPREDRCASGPTRSARGRWSSSCGRPSPRPRAWSRANPRLQATPTLRGAA